MIKLQNVNIVLTANQFNPTIFSQLWLVRENIIQEDDIKHPNSLFIPVCSRSYSKTYELLVVPERLQLTLLKVQEPKTDCEVMVPTVRKIIQLLHHTPFTGMGFNFIWLYFFEDNEKNFRIVTKTFYKKDLKIFNAFDKNKTKIGSIINTSWDKFSLTIKIQPTKIVSKDKAFDCFMVDYNYHFLFQEKEDYKKLLGVLDSWQKARLHSKEITEKIYNGIKQ